MWQIVAWSSTLGNGTCPVAVLSFPLDAGNLNVTLEKTGVGQQLP
jgi:hypothetical protein